MSAKKIDTLVMAIIMVAVLMGLVFAIFFFTDWAKERFGERNQQVQEDEFIQK